MPHLHLMLVAIIHWTLELYCLSLNDQIDGNGPLCTHRFCYFVQTFLHMHFIESCTTRTWHWGHYITTQFRKSSISSPSSISFCSCGKKCIKTGSMLSFVSTRSDCHLTIITLIHWIKIDHVLL